MSCKHKERKPKKPHYIPRPWGKPYNYKCFQCPFTCMEKSHLYNHMKYSLCKNSLSLLIESDWPFKKGSPVQPEQLRLQQAEPPVTVDAREEEQDKEAEPPPHQEAQEAPESRGGGRSKQEAELVMADVFSLEEQLLRARSVEVESKLRHYRLSLSERWRVLSAPPKPPDGVAPPCYPAPSLECSDASGLNLSLLGVGYPLAPGLLSYLNPAAAPPFLPGRHPDRALLPPHLYYPFLCEHGFGVAAEAGKIVKPQPTPQSTPQPTPKPGLWKVPALQTSWSSSPDLLMERGRGREDRAGWQQDTGVKRAAGPSDVQDVPVEKKKVLDFHLPTLKNTYKSASDASQTHSSSRGAASLPPRLTAHQEEEEGPNAKRRDSNLDPAALLRDFTTLMHEYQSTEQRAASLPQQRHLWAHLGKIRAELAHIQEALEHRAWPNEGPLDLSVRRQPAGGPDQLGGRGIPGETKDVENESEEETDEEEEEEPKDLYHKCSALDALVRLAPPHAPLLKGEVLDGGVALWHGRTTKCEADSSVLLCSKTPNRPPSIQQLDTLPSIDSV